MVKFFSGEGSRLSGGECWKTSGKERIRIKQKEHSTNVRVTDV